MDKLYLLDTNILVHIVRQDAMGQYIKAIYAPLMAIPRPVICTVTEGELRSLALQWTWGLQKLDRMRFLLTYFDRVSIERLVVQEAYAAIDTYSEAVGRSMARTISGLPRQRRLPEPRF